MSDGRFSALPERHPREATDVITEQGSRVASPTIYIDPSFETEVGCHYLANALDLEFSSLILAIEGPPGEGKSFQLVETIKKLGVPYQALSASGLSGVHEGDAIEPLEKAYKSLSDQCERSGLPGCLIIDDMDLSIAGQHERTEYTVNSQLLSSLLMNLADNPTRLRNQRVRRSAVYFTGNDLGKLYGPLRRKGRCRLFRWEPTTTQKLAMLTAMLESVGVRKAGQVAADVMRRRPHCTVAAFRASIEEWTFRALRNHVAEKRSMANDRIRQSVSKSFALVDAEQFLSCVDGVMARNFSPSLVGEPR